MIDKVLGGRTLTFVFYDGRMDKKGSLERPPFSLSSEIPSSDVGSIAFYRVFSLAMPSGLGSISCRGVE